MITSILGEANYIIEQYMTNYDEKQKQKEMLFEIIDGKLSSIVDN